MNGLLLLDKPSHMTSFDAVARVRRLSGTRRVGHTGTLDPLATGVLPVLLGQATRLSSFLLAADKRYTAHVRLGLQTDTFDITGRVLQRRPVTVSDRQLTRALSDFTGALEQIPPMYSAVKHNGVRLYQLARAGIEVPRQARSVHVYANRLLSRTGDDFVIDVHCSKGTYIRALCDDIGKALGCGAVLTALRRTQTGGFCERECVALDRLDAQNLRGFLEPPARIVSGYPAVGVTQKQSVRFLNGGALSLDRLPPLPYEAGASYRVCFEDRFLGMGQVDAALTLLAPVCVFSQDS